MIDDWQSRPAAAFSWTSAHRRLLCGAASGRFCEHGAALVAALMITSLVAALVACLVSVVVTESRVGRHHQSAESGAYAATAAVERLIGELRHLPTWQFVPSTPSLAAEFNDGRTVGMLPDGTALDLARLTAERQAASDTFYPGGADRPVWRLYAHASLGRIISGDPPVPNAYVVVWVADDPDETDGDPTRDSNGAVLARADAYGVRGGWRALEVTLAATAVRDDTGAAVASRVTVIAWREAR